MLPVDEAERAAEQLLGPYTADEHSKRRVVVREARLNRAYVDPALQPAERADPDAGKKKRVRGPEELETGGPISAVPLRAVGVCVAGEVAVGAPGPPPRKTSRVPVGPLEAVGSASSSAASLAVSPRAGVGQTAAGSFAIASLNLEEVSGGTPSEVYACRTDDTRVEARVDGADAGALEFVCRAASCLPWLMIFFLCWCAARVGPVPGASEEVSGGLPEAVERGGEASGPARVDEAGGTSAAGGAADVGGLCTLDFKVSPAVTSVCQQVGDFAAPACLSGLFKRMAMDKMFRLIEANAMRVSVT